MPNFEIDLQKLPIQNKIAQTMRSCWTTCRQVYFDSFFNTVFVETD